MDVLFRIIQDLHFGAHLLVSATHLVCVFVLQHQRLQSHPDAERESRRVHGCPRDARMRRVVDDHGSGSKVGAFRALYDSSFDASHHDFERCEHHDGCGLCDVNLRLAQVGSSCVPQRQ